MPSSRFDALVVGGGPGGLTAALYLARFRRRVLLVDEGCSRAIKIPRTHNMPGYPDGVVGAELVAAIRRQAERYGVEFAAGRVDSLEKTGGGFIAHREGEPGTVARTVLLATGTSDREPAMPYIAEAVRTGALRYCPVCDGYEVIDQAVGILTDSPRGAGEALYLRNFTSRVALFSASTPVDFSEQDRREMAGAGIVVVPERVESIRFWGGVVTLRHGSQESTCDSLYGALGLDVHSELALDAERDETGYLLTDRRQKTSIDGLYAAGDVSRGLNQISVAMGEAAIAASAMHLALGRRW